MNIFHSRRPAKEGGAAHPRPHGFTESVNWTESRANTVRPLDRSLREYYLATSIMALSLGVPVWWPWLMPFLFAPQERSTSVGSLVYGVGFVVMGGLSLSVYLLDILNRVMLAHMDTRQLRRRLAKATPSRRYVARRRHLRGMKIGAWFFGSYALVIFVALVVRMLSGGIPK